MRLAIRRAWGAKGLLLAGAGAAFIAVVLLTGLADYSRVVAEAGARSAIASAPAEERSLLVTGPLGARFPDHDRALRAMFAGGTGGLAAHVSGAGYAVSRQVNGDAGDATPNSDGLVLASAVFLDGLRAHADLTAGGWPRPGGDPVQVTLPERAAVTLGWRVGQRVPLTDRLTGAATQVVVTGIWHPRDTSDPYWRLAPGVVEGVSPRSAAYGPLVMERADFLAGFADTASAGWLIAPDLAAANLNDLGKVQRAIVTAARAVPERSGMGASSQVATEIDRLYQRLRRADLVGRSTLLTPILMIIILGGYALLMVAMLLTEHRTVESALMRARGAARPQLAGLAVREAALILLPAAALAPLAVVLALRLAAHAPILTTASITLRPHLNPLTWMVAAASAAGCLAAMTVPSLRQGGTYIADLTRRSRPERRAVAQRVGLDLALLGFAALAWMQLRQYSSPLTRAGATLGIDPLLAGAPTLGVLAGAVVALRVVPPLTRLAERYVDRKPWNATMLGMWQAGRRPHAGPVLLLALAVAVSTLAWSLASSAARSVVDQADHRVGADLRLVENSGFPPPGRAAEVRSLPGVGAALPAWRIGLDLGERHERTTLVALDAAAAGNVVRLRDDLAGGSSRDELARLAAARVPSGTVPLPDGVRQLRGTVAGGPRGWAGAPMDTTAILADDHGQTFRVPLARTTGQPAQFSVDVPDTAGRPLHLAGFEATASVRLRRDERGTGADQIDWRISHLTAVSGAGVTPIDLGAAGRWAVADPSGPAANSPVTVAPAGREIQTRYAVSGDGLSAFFIRSSTFLLGSVRFSVMPGATGAPVPALVTPQALTAMHAAVGGTTRLVVEGTPVPVRVVDEIAAVPGVTDTPAALLIDLPSLSDALFAQRGGLRSPQEWWLATGPGQHVRAAAAARELSGLRVLDRRAIAAAAGHDPYGQGGRAGLFAAALGAILLAAVGIAVDVRATARRRLTELAVLHTLGAGPRLLARALIAEQAFLAGIGVAVGVVVGIAVAATMAPLVILTPGADRPVPPPVLHVAAGPVALTALGLLATAVAFSGLIALTMRQRLAAAQLRLGDDR